MDLWLRIIITAQAVGTSIVGILVFIWTRGANRKVADALIAQRLQQLEERFDRAGQKTSDLTNRIQPLARRDEVLAIEVAMKSELAKEHRFRGDQIAALSAQIGVVQTQVAKLEARVDGQDRFLANVT